MADSAQECGAERQKATCISAATGDCQETGDGKRHREKGKKLARAAVAGERCRART